VAMDGDLVVVLNGIEHRGPVVTDIPRGWIARLSAGGHHEVFLTTLLAQQQGVVDLDVLTVGDQKGHAP
jgi:hypothetical protein